MIKDAAKPEIGFAASACFWERIDKRMEVCYINGSRAAPLGQGGRSSYSICCRRKRRALSLRVRRYFFFRIVTTTLLADIVNMSGISALRVRTIPRNPEHDPA